MSGRPTIPAKEFERIRIHLGLRRDEFALELGLNGSVDTNAEIIKDIEMGNRNASLPMAKLVWMLGQFGVQDWPEGLLATPLQKRGGE